MWYVKILFKGKMNEYCGDIIRLKYINIELEVYICVLSYELGCLVSLYCCIFNYILFW